ncbi:MAG: hypothetical protein ACYCOU_23030 [Sulfobacillus sp.]
MAKLAALMPFGKVAEFLGETAADIRQDERPFGSESGDARWTPLRKSSGNSRVAVGWPSGRRNRGWAGRGICTGPEWARAQF